MKSVRMWIREIFGFSRGEINGFLILVPLMILAVLSEPAYHRWSASRDREFLQDSIQLNSLVAQWRANAVEQGQTPAEQDLSKLNFDPNAISVDDLRKLGFSASSSNRIAAYRRNGGVFSVKSDLLKIYGLDSALYNQLYDYIQLPEEVQEKGDRRFLRLRTIPGVFKPKPDNGNITKEKAKFDINTADTLLLKSVYGIGSRLAARIIKFREGLGGFINTDQLFEVYGLDSTIVMELVSRCFVMEDFTPVKVNINSADEKQLSAHPYIRRKLAYLLVSYRFQHGDFKEVSDIKKLSSVPTVELERLLPYIAVGGEGAK